MHQPLISVVIPTFNAQQYLIEAIESVTRQSWRNLEILILDDGSEDNTVIMANAFADERVKVYGSSENKGQSYQLNKGIALSTGEYICIMHSDDVMHENKLEQQLLFLKDNPLVGVCGCNVQLIGARTDVWLFPEKDQDCKDLLLSAVPFAHPAVLLRRSVLEGMGAVYDVNMVAAEDYDLWVRLADKTRFGNVQQLLLQYRIHSMQLSEVKKEAEKILVDKIRMKLVRYLFKIPNETDVLIAFRALYHTEELNAADAVKGVALVWNGNKMNGIFSSRVLKGKLKHIVYKILSGISLKQRINYLITNSALIEISFFKSMVRVLVSPQKM